jgi:hypothetical protein
MMTLEVPQPGEAPTPTVPEPAPDVPQPGEPSTPAVPQEPTVPADPVPAPEEPTEPDDPLPAEPA